MESTSAIDILSALAQETRLAAFRLAVRAGPGGIAAGDLAEALGVRANTLSAHLGQLSRAGLVQAERDGRSIRYSARMEVLGALIGFLAKDCCNGDPGLCLPDVAAGLCRPQAAAADPTLPSTAGNATR